MLRYLLLSVLAALVLAEEGPQPRLSKNVVERVEGGEVADPHSWPWQISLQFRVRRSWYHTCGGTLIRTRWVMTAAHCIDRQRAYWRVVLGDHDLFKEEGTEQFINVSTMHIHPSWNSNNVAAGYDIALLHLYSDASLNSNVQLGSLSPANLDLSSHYVCFITGWGRMPGGNLSDQLKRASLSIVDHSTCSSRDWWGSTVKTSMVCAGTGSQSGCQGDSGGPLNCRIRNRFIVYGVTSFVSSQGCNTKRKPTVFTRVSAYISWIQSIIG